MDIILKSTLNGKYYNASADTTATSPDPNPSDPWLFTDPVASDLYLDRKLMNRLEEDIRTYVMYDNRWASDELEGKLEVRRLLQEGSIAPMGSFGCLSPHPTVYCTLKGGAFMVCGQEHAFDTGEYLIFEPWLARYSEPGLNGPLHVGQLYHASSLCLCSDSFPNVCIHCDNTRATMRAILNYRKKK